MATSHPYPRLRPVEVFPAEHNGQQVLVMQDPLGLAVGPIALSHSALFIFSLLDGQHDGPQIQEKFVEQFGQPLPDDQLDEIVQQLDAARYLESEGFTQYMQAQRDAYRKAPARISMDQATLGADGDGLAATIERLLTRNERVRPGAPGGKLVGLVAPHLDFARGQVCYADVYGLLGETKAPRRVVILGTNHRGLGASVIATRKDFQTPLGTTRTDRTFLERIEARCGVDLCEHELDHQREHSVELQLLILQHVLGPDHFTMVPVLCPDPCGPTGTAPLNGQGVDLRVFGEALRDVLAADGDDTLVIAGADLSHVGRHFGDDCELEDSLLREVETQDRAVLDTVVAGEQGRFLQTLTAHDNSTHVCSAGCLYALMTALPTARRELLRYHQAVDRAHGICVSCSSMAFWEA